MSDPAMGDPAVNDQTSNWNIPNVLTGLRIVMVPFFGWALLHDGGDSVLWRTVAFALFVGAMVTDKIDGDIARKRNLVTNFGKIADPIADKAITGMAFIGLSIVGDIWWWVTIVVLLREWSVTLLRLSILKHVVVAAAQSGKVKTVLQAIALSTLCLPLRQVTGEPWESIGLVMFYVAQVLLAGAVAMTLWSGYEFFRDVWRQRGNIRQSAVS
jgi:CDP-diacylglycerol--glycerol-3-phosphate 3-phosphatidyltransferase